MPKLYQNPVQYPVGSGTNWFDILLRNAASQNYNLTYSAGAPDLKLSVHLNYNRQDGVMLNTNYERFTTRTNVSYTGLKAVHCEPTGPKP